MEKIYVWVGYGKNERYVDARYVDDVKEFIANTVYDVRNIWGWQKQLVFYVGERNRERIVVE